jgi:hypothetical protein
MDPVRLGLLAAAVSAAVAAAAFLLSRLRGRGGAAAAGPALAAGFVAGYLVVAGLPKGTPAETWQWLLPIAAAAAVLASAEGFAARRAPLLRWAPRLALASFAAWAALLPDHRTAPGLAGAALGIAALGGGLEGAAARAGPRSSLAIVLAAAAAAAVSLGVSGSMLLGQMGGGLAAAAGACLLLTVRFPPGVGAVPAVAATVLGSLLLDGVELTDMPRITALLVAAAPLAAWAPVPASWSGTRRAALARIALVVLVAGAGAAVAVAESPPMDF